MPHAHNRDCLFGIIDEINDPVISNPDAPALFPPLQLADTGWLRFLAQGQNALVDPREKGRGQLAQICLSRPLDP
jgi:hypothetical protein